jgi:hypothetical protein
MDLANSSIGELEQRDLPKRRNATADPLPRRQFRSVAHTTSPIHQGSNVRAVKCNSKGKKGNLLRQSAITKLYFTQLLAENYSQKGNSIERQVQKGKKGSCLFGHVTFFFISIELPFWFCHLLASCLSGFFILPFWL